MTEGKGGVHFFVFPKLSCLRSIKIKRETEIHYNFRNGDYYLKNWSQLFKVH